jgi:hypothetical protein
LAHSKAEKEVIMKKIVQSVTALIVAMAMVSAPVVEAQTRGRQSSTTTSTSSGARQSGVASRSTNNSGSTRQSVGNSNGNTRPSAGTSNTRPNVSNTNNTRPSVGSGTTTSTVNTRPNNNTGNIGASNNNSHNNGNYNNTNRPSGNVGNVGNNRPNNNVGVGNMKPGNNYGSVSNQQPITPRPIAAGYHHSVPFFGNFNRPVPPVAWRYHSGGPVFGSILGVALGTAIGTSISALINSGYTVNSYGNDVVYLTNVPQMNFTWPDAALYYSNGILTGSQFTYATSFYDMSRYNSLYSVFLSQYGAPVQTENRNGVISATWFGAGNRYVSLSYSTQYGGMHYTTLSFGN